MSQHSIHLVARDFGVGPSTPLRTDNLWKDASERASSVSENTVALQDTLGFSYFFVSRVGNLHETLGDPCARRSRGGIEEAPAVLERDHPVTAAVEDQNRAAYVSDPLDRGKSVAQDQTHGREPVQRRGGLGQAGEGR